MKLFTVTLLVFLLSFAGLAVGILLQRPGIRRTCARTGEGCRCDNEKQNTDCDCA